MTQRNQYNVVAIFHLNWLWASGFGDDKRRVKVSQNKRQKSDEKEENKTFSFESTKKELCFSFYFRFFHTKGVRGGEARREQRDFNG